MLILKKINEMGLEAKNYFRSMSRNTKGHLN
jgi:hypothetical protein